MPWLDFDVLTFSVFWGWTTASWLCSSSSTTSATLWWQRWSNVEFKGFPFGYLYICNSILILDSLLHSYILKRSSSSLCLLLLSLTYQGGGGCYLVHRKLCVRVLILLHLLCSSRLLPAPPACLVVQAVGLLWTKRQTSARHQISM